MFRLPGLFSLILFFIILRLDSSRADSTDDPWKKFNLACSKLKTPPGLELRISSDKTRYYAGEPILITTTYEMKGPEQAKIETRNYDRSGRLGNLYWTVVGPDGKLASDPLSVSWLSGMGGGLGGGPDVISEGNPVSQKFYLNEWARFELPGEYEIALISKRLQGPWKIASNRIKIKIRKPSVDEVYMAARKYARILDAPKPECGSKNYEERRKALLFLRFLHHEKAVPYYFKYLNDDELSYQAACGLYGLPDRRKTFNMVYSRIYEKDFPVSEIVYWLFVNLYHSIHYSPEKAKNIELRYQLPEDRKQAIVKRLRKIAAGKNPKARAVSVLTLTSWNEKDSDYAVELAKCLKDLPKEKLYKALYRLKHKKSPGISPYLEKYVRSPDRDVRTCAIAGLINQGNKKYMNIYLDDYVSEKPYYSWISDFPKELSEERQLKLASYLDHPDRDIAEGAAKRLCKFASSKKLVPYIKKGIQRWRHPYGPKPYILEIWAKVAPEEAKSAIFEFMKSNLPSIRSYGDAGILKYYLDDPEAIALLTEIARSGDGYRAREVLMNAKRPEIVPILLEYVRARKDPEGELHWSCCLERVTGHILPLTTDHDTPAKRKAVIDEWERWWNANKDKSVSERARLNIEHAISLLDSEEISARANYYLVRTAGKDFSPDLYMDKDGNINCLKLKELWTDWWKKNSRFFVPVKK